MRRRHATLLCSNHTKLVVACLFTMVLSGCSKGLPTDPMSAGDPAATVTKAVASPTATTSTNSWTWYSLMSQWVNKGEAATVSGGRYKVQFVRGSLGQGATIVIMERDPSIADVVVGPSGTVLSKAATLTINYAGSAVALSPEFLKLYRLNESTGAWEVVAGTNDLASKVFTAKVSVLCRYALSITDPTKAGW
jgi:hypothetical protein